MQTAVEMKKGAVADRPFQFGQEDEFTGAYIFTDHSPESSARQDLEPVREMYRVFAPYHCILESGTIEFGLFSDVDLARGRLAEVARAMSEHDRSIDIQWRSQDAFVAVTEAYGVTTTRRYYIRKVHTNTPFIVQISGYKGGGL